MSAPKWAVEAANEIANSYDEVCGERTPVPVYMQAAIIAKHSPVEALTEALDFLLADYRGRTDILPTVAKMGDNALALARGEK